MNIEIRHARLVVALAESGSISKASARLDLPQPAVSTQLRRIEKALGGDLFVRSRTGVECTELGARLVPLMSELALRADAISAEATAGTDRLRIGMAEWTPVGLRRAIGDAVDCPALDTRTLDASAGTDAVLAGSLDAAIVVAAPDVVAGRRLGPFLESSVLVHEPVWVAGPLPCAGTLGPDVGDLRGSAWVVHEHDHWFSAVERHVFDAVLGFEPSVVHRAAGHAEAMSWVRDAGVRALATPTGASGDVDLRALPGGRDAPSTRMDLVWRRDTLRERTVAAIVGAVRAYYCGYARTMPHYWSWYSTSAGGRSALSA